MQKIQYAKIIEPKQLKTSVRKLPKSWTEAAGMLKHHKKDLEQHVKQIRKEWGRGR